MSSRQPDTFANPELAAFWRYISSTLDRFMDVVADCTVDELNWRPPAPDTNSIYVLAVHTLANARQNILGTLCGQDITRNRDEEFVQIADEQNARIPTWSALRADLERSLAGLDPLRLDVTVEHANRGVVTGREILIIVARHAAEHLGQAELTRDLAHAAGPGQTT
jgi:hypothetical protein